MLLRRIIEHTKSQNWTAVFLDFVIVVVGVFIGIQVSNWNDARVENDKMQLIHSRLQADFSMICSELELATSEHDGVVQSLETLRIVLERGSARPEEDTAIRLALRNGYEYWQVSHRSGTFIELLSSGKLDLISDESLRVALIRYDRRSQQSRFNLEQIRANMHPDVSKFLKYRKIGSLARDDEQRIVLSPVVSYDIEAMVSDEEFKRVVDQIFEMQTWIQINMHRSLRHELSNVVSLLGNQECSFVH